MPRPITSPEHILAVQVIDELKKTDADWIEVHPVNLKNFRVHLHLQCVKENITVPTKRIKGKPGVIRCYVMRIK